MALVKGEGPLKTWGVLGAILQAWPGPSVYPASDSFGMIESCKNSFVL